MSKGRRAALTIEPATCATRVPAKAALRAKVPAVANAEAETDAADEKTRKNLAPNSTFSSGEVANSLEARF